MIKFELEREVLRAETVHTHNTLSVITQGLQVCKWYLLWGLKSINRTYFGLFGAPGLVDITTDHAGRNKWVVP